MVLISMGVMSFERFVCIPSFMHGLLHQMVIERDIVYQN